MRVLRIWLSTVFCIFQKIGDLIAFCIEDVFGVGGLDEMQIVRSAVAGLIGHGRDSHCCYNICDGMLDSFWHWFAWVPIWNNTYILLVGLTKAECLDMI